MSASAGSRRARVPTRAFDDVRLELIEHIYAASTEPARWGDFLDRLTHWFWGGCSIYMMPGSLVGVTRFLASNRDPAFIRSHDDYYAARRVWMVNDGPAKSVVELSESQCPEDRLLRTEYYNDWLRPQEMHHGLSCRLKVGNDSTLRLGIGRASRYGIYTPEEQRVLATLAPHMGRAVEITRRLDLLDAEARAGTASFDQLTIAALLVDSAGKMVFCNRAADALLKAGDGLVARHGRLQAASAGDAHRLAAAITSAASGRGSATLRISRPLSGTSLSATISPIRERASGSFGLGSLALVLIANSEADTRLNEPALRALYDLTAAEARLAVALCAGSTLAEYAAMTGTSVNTAKFHLKSLFGKTGEVRQPDLIRRLMANPLLRLHDTVARE